MTSTNSAITSTTTASSTSDIPNIDESVAFSSTDDSTSIESSSSTASLSPTSSSPSNHDNEFVSLRQRFTSKFTTTKRRVTFGLQHNVTRLIETYTDNWLTKAELRAIRCGGLHDIESNRVYFQGYLQSIDAATLHINYTKEFQTKGHRGGVKPDDSQNQKVLMDTLTCMLISGCNLGFRGLEHGSKDAHIRRASRSLAASAIIANHRLIFTIGKSNGSMAFKEWQFRKYCESLSYNSRIWACYMAMIDATAAMQEYATIPQSLLQYKNVSTKVPNVVVVPFAYKPSIVSIIQRLSSTTIHILHSDHNCRRGYQRLSHHDDEEGAFPVEHEPYTNRPQHSSPSKKTKTLLRKAIQRLKSSSMD